MPHETVNYEKTAKHRREASALSGLVRLLKAKHYYMVWTDYRCNISVKCNKQSEITRIKERFPDYDFIECGAITYWFMKHQMPKLAMLSFWR